MTWPFADENKGNWNVTNGSATDVTQDRSVALHCCTILPCVNSVKQWWVLASADWVPLLTMLWYMIIQMSYESVTDWRQVLGGFWSMCECWQRRGKTSIVDRWWRASHRIWFRWMWAPVIHGRQFKSKSLLSSSSTSSTDRERHSIISSRHSSSPTSLPTISMPDPSGGTCKPGSKCEVWCVVHC